MSTLLETINGLREHYPGVDSWIGKLLPFDEENFPGTLKLSDLVYVEASSKTKAIAPRSLPTPLLSAHLERSGAGALGTTRIVSALVNAFEPVVHGWSLTSVIGRELTLQDLRDIGPEGLNAFDNLRQDRNFEIISQLVAVSQ